MTDSGSVPGHPHVCFVGGEDLHLRLPLSSQLNALGIPVSMMGTAARPELLHGAMRYALYPMSLRFNPVADIRTVWRLTQVLRETQPDIVHAFDTKPGILAPVAGQRANVPIKIRTVTGMGRLFSSASMSSLALRGVYDAVQRRVASVCDMTVFQNEDDRAYFLNNALADEQHCSLIRGSGVDTKRISSSADTRSALRTELGLTANTVFIMVTRLIPEKGVAEYLEAARRIRATAPTAAFLLVGPVDSASKRSELLEQIRGHADDVIYLGARNDVPALLHASDVFVLPTRYREGIPRVLLEAGAAGLASITTDMPGCRDVVKHGWNGCIVRPGDVQDLVSAMTWMLTRPDLRLEMGRRGATIVETRFSLSAVARSYADLYLQLWRKHSHG